MSASYFLMLLIVAHLLHIRKVGTVRRMTLIGGIVGIGAAIGILVTLCTGEECAILIG